MGINGLTPFLKKRCKKGIKVVNLSEYKDKIIAIDVSIFLYKYVYIGNYLECFLKQIIKLFEHKITPVYIFDGKPSKNKDDVIEKRRKVREKNEEKIVNLNNDILILNQMENDIEDKEEKIEEKQKQINKIKKNTIYVTQTHINNLISLLKIIGIKYIVSSSESDITCKTLDHLNLVSCNLTEDMDFLTHNCKKILRDFDYNKNVVTEYDLSEILEEIDLTYKEFVDLCILMGCDYSNKINGIGPVTAYKYIKKYKTIEDILKNIKMDDINFDYIRARSMFELYHNIECNDLKIGNLNKNELVQFLDNNDINQKYITKLRKLTDIMKIKSITTFFQKK